MPDLEISGIEVKLCLFAHYDPAERIADYVYRYLEHLVQAGFKIVFVSTSKFGGVAAARLDKLCVDVIVRENTGYDFGSWAVAYQRYGEGFSGELLLANNSVYGPISALEPALSKLRRARADFVGMVESGEGGCHIQSWFVLLSERVHQSEAFRALMSTSFVGLDKAQIVASGERALTSHLVAAGFTYAALFPLASAGLVMQTYPVNPTHWQWRRIVRRGVPFIKVDLLRDNPQNLPNVASWVNLVGRDNPVLLKQIKAHLADAPRRDAGVAPSRAGRLLIAVRYACYSVETRTGGFLALVAWRIISGSAAVALSIMQGVRLDRPV